MVVSFAFLQRVWILFYCKTKKDILDVLAHNNSNNEMFLQRSIPNYNTFSTQEEKNTTLITKLWQFTPKIAMR